MFWIFAYYAFSVEMFLKTIESELVQRELFVFISYYIKMKVPVV